MSTHFHPRTAPPLSPARPGTSQSTRSTVRAVPPSPDSPKDALQCGPTEQSIRPSEIEQSPGIDGSDGSAAKNDQAVLTNHIHDAENHDFPTTGTPHSLQHRGATWNRFSREKSRSQSPRKQPPNLPSHQESASPEEREYEESECPETPSPMTREQQRLAYAPLQVSATVLDELDPTDSLTKTRSKPLLLSRTQTDTRHRAALTCNPIPKNEPRRHVSISGQSNMSNVSAASKRTVFFTPGRDELERKKALVEVDDGPFAKAVSMQDLEERRRRMMMMVSEGKEAKRKERSSGCGGACSIM